jgi:hypothetical protein
LFPKKEVLTGLAADPEFTARKRAAERAAKPLGIINPPDDWGSPT